MIAHTIANHHYFVVQFQFTVAICPLLLSNLRHSISIKQLLKNTPIIVHRPPLNKAKLNCNCLGHMLSFFNC